MRQEASQETPLPPASPEFTVRRLGPGDDADLLFIRARALLRAPAAFGSGPGDDRFDAPGFAAALLADRESVVYGAFRESIIGLVGLHPAEHRKTAHVLDLWGLYVEPEHRGLGVGKSLMLHAIGDARRVPGVSYVRLAVTDAAPEAAALYRSLGFVECGYESDALRLDGMQIEETSMRLTLEPDSA